MGALCVLAQMRLVPFPRERERVGGGTLGTGPYKIGVFTRCHLHNPPPTRPQVATRSKFNSSLTTADSELTSS